LGRIRITAMSGTNYGIYGLLWLVLIGTVLEVLRSRQKDKTAKAATLGFIGGILVTMVVGLVFRWSPEAAGHIAVVIGIVVAFSAARQHSASTRKKPSADNKGK
jgi:peptidoglycan/LPS O-acetylase OafA/YrhL